MHHRAKNKNKPLVGSDVDPPKYISCAPLLLGGKKTRPEGFVSVPGV